MKKSVLKTVVVGIFTMLVSCIIMGLLNLLFLVPLNLHSVGFWMEMLIVILITGISILAFTYGKENKVTKGSIALVSLFILVFVIALFASSKLFNAKSYANLISIGDGNFNEEIIEADAHNLIVVDDKIAQKLGDRTIGSVKNSSWYEVDSEYNLISYKGDYYRISSLNYSSFFKYSKAGKMGIPGFVLVNARNVQNENAQYIQLEKPIFYSPSAYWGKDLSRHLFFQYPTYILGKSFFEIDDLGNAFWITSVKTHEIGLFGGEIVKSVIITDANNGESIEYTIEDLPEWVEHSIEVNLLMNQIENSYRYFDGWFNGTFAKTGVYSTSYQYRGASDEAYTPFDGYNTVITKNGDIYFSTGVTPANNAEAIKGFVLVSPRTGKSYFYNCDGAEEASAQKQAEGLVSNYMYSASYPTVINLGGVETYFMTLKSSSGLVQKYALCNVKNYSICVVGDTIEETIKKYKIELGLETAENDSSLIETKNISGQVSFVSQAEIDGNTYYYFMIEGDKNSIFKSSIKNNDMQPINLKVGAKVLLDYYVSSTDENIMIVKKIEF